MAETNLARFRTVVEGALVALEARRDEVNDLNVFPVADGDTGDNMVLTLRAVLSELDRLQEDSRTLDEIGRDEIVDLVARAALLGARGNSGVILSQLIRGAAEELISRPGELVDPILIGAAMAQAADRAYASVRSPAEGTILTVMREMAHRVAYELAHAEHLRLAPGDEGAKQNQAIAEVLDSAIEAGVASVARGPELLPALREAGVVDAGGHALTIVFAGMVGALRGDAPEIPAEAPAPESARVTHPEHQSTTFRYCVNFAVTGRDLDRSDWVPQLEAIGDSVLVVGDRSTLRVHVHTDAPEGAPALFDGAGAVSRLDVADMHEQIERRSERLASPHPEPSVVHATGALAVVSGGGIRTLYAGLGVYALDGGPTLNPSTYDLLAGIHAVPAEAVVVLPNSTNVVMAAERAAELSEKDVRVVPTESQQAGLVASVALDPTAPLDRNASAMGAAAEAVRTGGVAPAARDDAQGRFSVGDAVGYVGGELVAWGDPEAALRAVIDALSDDAELVTCLTGDGAPLTADVVGSMAPDGVELEIEEGGQPSWWWLLAAE